MFLKIIVIESLSPSHLKNIYNNISLNIIMKNYSEEIKELIKKHLNKGFEYGKPIEYLEFRNGCTKEDFERELKELINLEFTEKQIKEGEKRYKLYFVYSRKTSRVYVLTFREKIRIISIYPLGKSTIKKYNQVKFK